MQTRKKDVGLMFVLAFLLALATPNPAKASAASPGDLLVIDPGAGTGGNGALFTVDPTTGSRTILSDFGNAIQGPTGTPLGVALDASGTILVVGGPALGNAGHWALFTVDPTTGSRTILSDFGDATQGPTGVSYMASPSTPPAPSWS